MAENIAAEIEARLGVLAPEFVAVRDDSHLHAGHAGAAGGGHFQLRIVSEAFAGLPRIARHRLVYDALNPLMAGRIHALSMILQTPEEAGL